MNIETVADKEKWALIRAHLQTLTHSEGWDCYSELLGSLENEKIQELLNEEAGRHDFLRGYVLGLRRACYLPAEILKKLQG